MRRTISSVGSGAGWTWIQGGGPTGLWASATQIEGCGAEKEAIPLCSPRDQQRRATMDGGFRGFVYIIEDRNDVVDMQLFHDAVVIMSRRGMARRGAE